MGAGLIALSPELPKHSRKLIEQKKLKFEILQDAQNEVAQRYGLRWTFPEDLKQLYLSFGINLAEANGEDSWTLALAARFIITPDRKVHYARVDADYTRRPEPLETLDALRQWME